MSKAVFLKMEHVLISTNVFMFFFMGNKNTILDNKDKKIELYHIYEELMYYTHDILFKFPEKEQLSLIADIKNNINEGMKYVIFVFKSYDNQNKLKYLNLLDANIKMLCFLVRLSLRYRYINKRNYLVWSSKINNVNTKVGEYIKLCVKH